MKIIGKKQHEATARLSAAMVRYEKEKREVELRGSTRQEYWQPAAAVALSLSLSFSLSLSLSLSVCFFLPLSLLAYEG
jgi:hypothetical protein